MCDDRAEQRAPRCAAVGQPAREHRHARELADPTRDHDVAEQPDAERGEDEPESGPGKDDWIAEAVWHHAATDGCSHAGRQHNGTVTLTLVQRINEAKLRVLIKWTCTATYFGTLDGEGAPGECVTPDCDDERKLVAMFLAD